jgi:hypothetical protein
MSAMSAAVSAVVAALSGVAVPVHRVRMRPLAASVAGAVCVRPVRADVAEAALAPGMPITWRVGVEVECYARVPAGVAPDLAVDPFVSDVYQRLLTDPTLGAAVIDVSPQSLAYDFDIDAEAVACATLVFSIFQRAGTGATL